MLCSESVLRLRDYLVLLQHCGSFVKKKSNVDARFTFALDLTLKRNLCCCHSAFVAAAMLLWFFDIVNPKGIPQSAFPWE